MKEKDIERILDSASSIERTSPPPFLLTRIEARLDAAAGFSVRPKVRPAGLVAALCVLVLLVLSNYFVIRSSTGSHVRHTSVSQATSAGSTDYSLTDNLDLYH